jgi:N-acetyl-anhydromuramyl-L-alanine amidase AmpD
MGLVASLTLAWFVGQAPAAEKPGTKLERTGDEIVVAGQLFHTGTPVVTWMDPGGYDAYRVERRFAPMDRASFKTTTAEVEDLKSPNRYGMRIRGLEPEVVERVRGGGWDLDTLRKVVDQFVIHYDVAGTSKRCFQVLHDARGLSVHFMLDLDGTIYQTLDLKEGAWHATIANNRSVGIEIANMGAYRADSDRDPFANWYKTGDDGKTHITIPGGIENSGLYTLSDGSLRVPLADLRPSRDQPVVGEVQGQTLRQYDLTPQQYDALIKLTATLCTVFPKITCDYPRDPSGHLVTRKLPDETLKGHHGLLGHYHVQTNKTDPGPAFQWDKVVDGARALMAK